MSEVHKLQDSPSPQAHAAETRLAEPSSIRQRSAITAYCAILGAVLAYVLSDFGDWPKLSYWPVRSQWAFTDHSHPDAIRYWGAVLWAIGGAAVGVLVARLTVLFGLDRHLPEGDIGSGSEPSPSPIVPLLGSWSLAALLIASLYVVWTLWPW